MTMTRDCHSLASSCFFSPLGALSPGLDGFKVQGVILCLSALCFVSQGAICARERNEHSKEKKESEIES